MKCLVCIIVLSTSFFFVSCPNPVDQQDTTPPGEVANLSATAEDCKVTLSWENPADEDIDHLTIIYAAVKTLSVKGSEAVHSLLLGPSSVIRRIEEAVQFKDIVLTVTEGSTGTVCDGLENGTEYTFTVTVFDEAGNESAGQSINATPTAGATTSQDEVANLSAAAGDRQVTLTWTDPADAAFDHCEVWYGTGGTSDTQFSGTIAAAGTTVTGLTNDSEYTFTVKTVDTAGTVSAGTTVKATPTSQGSTEVTNLTAVCGDGVILLYWDEPVHENYSHCEVWYGTGGTADTQFNGTPNPSGSVFSGLTNGVQYIVKVKTVDTEGNVSAGAAVLATPSSVPPDAPEIVDLTPTSIDTPSSVSIGQYYTFSGGISNNGNKDVVTAVTVRFYSSADATITESDTHLGDVTLNSVPSGGEVSFSESLKIATSLSAGSYYFGFIVDTDNAVTEEDENNNATEGSLVKSYTATAAAVDLHPATFEPTRSVFAGDAYTFYGSVRNSGSQDINETVYSQIFFSVDSTITTDDEQIGKGRVTLIPGGDTVGFNAEVRIPDDVPSGTYYVGFIADSDDRIAESNETNNSVVQQITVGGIGGTYDVKPWTFTTPTDVLPGNSYTFSGTLANGSTTTTPNFLVAFYASDDTIIEATDTLLGVFSFPVVAPSDTNPDFQKTLTIPEDIPADAQYFGYIVDAANDIPETDETNNITPTNMVNSFSMVNVDLKPYSFSSPALVQAGETYGFSGTVSNAIGGAVSETVTIQVYLSSDTFIGPPDTLLGSTTLGSFDAYNKADFSCSFDVPGSLSGPGYFGYLIDTGGAVEEVNESNNKTTGTLVQSYALVSIETIDNDEGVGAQCSMAIDGNDKLHIAYLDDPNNTLKYATNENGYWQTFSLEDGIYEGRDNIDIAVDSRNNHHISFIKGSNDNSVNLLSSNPSGWSPQTLVSASWDREYRSTSIAIDSGDMFHLGVAGKSTNPLSFNDGRLWYLTDESGSWNTVQLDVYDGSIIESSIALDSSNNAHITGTYGPQSVRYTTNERGSWPEDAEYLLDGGETASIIVDSTGIIHITCVKDGEWLYYITDDEDYSIGTGWKKHGIKSNQIILTPSIAVDSTGARHICAGQWPEMSLGYCVYRGDAWKFYDIPLLGPHRCTMVIDSNDDVHICLWNAVQGLEHIKIDY